MNEHDDWQAAQHQDECLRQQRIEEIIRASACRPLTEDEQREIAIEAGIGTLYTKEKK